VAEWWLGQDGRNPVDQLQQLLAVLCNHPRAPYLK
jgi:hypothetical protein